MLHLYFSPQFHLLAQNSHTDILNPHIPKGRNHKVHSEQAYMLKKYTGRTEYQDSTKYKLKK